MFETECEFKKIKPKKIYKHFIENKNFNEKPDFKKHHFKFVLDDKNIYNFYLHLKESLFVSIINLSSMASSIIENQFPKLYENFKDVNLDNIKTKLSLFKSFIINFNTGENDNNSIR